jgi:hypothetical protein
MKLADSPQANAGESILGHTISRFYPTRAPADSPQANFGDPATTRCLQNSPSESEGRIVDPQDRNLHRSGRIEVESNRERQLLGARYCPLSNLSSELSKQAVPVVLARFQSVPCRRA